MFIVIINIIINLKGYRLNSGSDSRPIIGNDFRANVTSQYRPAIIIQASIDHWSNIDSQHCKLGPIIGPIILSYMGYWLNFPMGFLKLFLSKHYHCYTITTISHIGVMPNSI